MPLKALEYMAPACEWSVFRSHSLCSLLAFALPVFVFASVLTLIAISVERCVSLLLIREGLTKVGNGSVGYGSQFSMDDMGYCALAKTFMFQ